MARAWLAAISAAEIIDWSLPIISLTSEPCGISPAQISSPCLFTRRLEGEIDLPVAHGEGKMLWSDANTEHALFSAHLPAFEYKIPPETAQVFPYNPNGSLRNVAGLCDPSGQILGLMPHPERHQFPWQHPLWTRGEPAPPLNGLDVFKNAIKVLSEA